VVATQFEFPVDQWFRGEYAQIPERMQDALKRYVLEGVAPGQFLTAVITNDLQRAVNHADSENAPLLKVYVQWFYNVAPAGCWGSRAVMLAWINQQTEQPVEQLEAT
jgi:hypothetical protein